MTVYSFMPPPVLPGAGRFSRSWGECHRWDGRRPLRFPASLGGPTGDDCPVSGRFPTRPSSTILARPGLSIVPLLPVLLAPPLFDVVVDDEVHLLVRNTVNGCPVGY